MFLLKHKNLFLFIALNYLDKAIAFALPLFVLFFISDISLYNNIEYIYSIATIGVVLVELGGRNYMIYGYSKEEDQDRESFLDNVKNFFSLLIIVYSFLLIVFILLGKIIILPFLFIPFIGIRILILLFTNYYSMYCRLIDKPQYVLYFSSVINVLTILILFLFKKFISVDCGLSLFFIVQIIVVVLLLILSLRKIRTISIKKSLQYLKRSFLFSWPIILNILLITFVNNFGKIYIYNNFSENDMYSFSYLLRISMVIQMAHASILAYYSKNVYLNKSRKIDVKLHRFYSLFLFLSAIGCLLIIIIINKLELIPSIHIGLTSIMLLLYVFLWCQQAFLEQYLGKMNKNKLLLVISTISLLVYLSMIFIFPTHVTVEYIALSMLISTCVALVILTGYFKYKKLI